MDRFKQGIIIAGILITGIGVTIFFLKDQLFAKPAEQSGRVEATPTTSPTEATVPSTTPTGNELVLKDGTYSATGNYFSPAGEQQISVDITLQNNVITAVTVTPGAFDHDSRTYERLFAQGIGKIVVGRKINEIQTVGVVNGSSLTGEGFMKALQDIQNQAAK